MFKFNPKRAVAVLAGIATGGAVIWFFDRKLPLYGSPFDNPISRHVTFDKLKKSNLDITLFQYQTCPFCCKVKTYLDYNSMDYKIVEVNGATKRQLRWTDYQKVPVVVVKENDEVIQLNDSSLIISILESYKNNNDGSLSKLNKYYPPVETTDSRGRKKLDFYNKYQIMLHGDSVDLERDKLEIQWRKWVDEEFVHTLSPNIYRTPSEAIEAFKYVSIIGDWKKQFGYAETYTLIYFGAFVMYFIGKRLKKRHNLDDDVRQTLFQQAKFWITALNSNNFLGGNEPNLADLAVYGVLNSIEGCSTFKDLMHQNPSMKSWYQRTKQAINLEQEVDMAH